MATSTRTKFETLFTLANPISLHTLAKQLGYANVSNLRRAYRDNTTAFHSNHVIAIHKTYKAWKEVGLIPTPTAPTPIIEVKDGEVKGKTVLDVGHGITVTITLTLPHGHLS